MNKIIGLVLGGALFATACHHGMYTHPVGVEAPRRGPEPPMDAGTAPAPVEPEGTTREPQPGISRRPPEEVLSPTVGTHMEARPEQAPPAKQPSQDQDDKKRKKSKKKPSTDPEPEGINTDATEGTLPTRHPDRVGTMQSAEPKGPTKQQNTYGDAPTP